MRKNKQITICVGLFIVLTIITQVGICSADSDKYTVMRRIQKTVQIINQQKEAGTLNPFEIMPLMQKVQKNFKAGNLKRANKLLDEVNRRLGECANVESPASVEYPIINGPYEKVSIIGEKAKNGIFDPSIEYDTTGTIGWMAYSAVEEPGYVHTHIAKSIDNGKSWTKIIEVNTATLGTIKGPGNKLIKGIWRHEVPALVHDPDDPGKEWKLFWHKYFVKFPFSAKDRMFKYGWIAYRYATTPHGPWSDEIALFGAGSFPPDPYSVEYNLNSLHSELNGMVAYSEPGSLYKNGVLYLALQCHSVDSTKIFLISLQNHGNNWEYLGTLLTQEDGQDFGYQDFVAPSLTKEKQRVFLLVSPHSPMPVDHDGTFVLEFEEVRSARLRRNKKGKLIIHKHFLPSIKGDYVNAGESDYDEHNTHGGVIMPQLDIKKAIDNKDLTVLDFQIFNTKEKIVD